MVWACCWRSVDTRTYNAARICGSFLSCCRRRRCPPQHELVRPVPPGLPIWLLAGLPPDLEGAPHGCPPRCRSLSRRGTPASAAAVATSSDEAGHGGSSRSEEHTSELQSHSDL